MDILYAIYSSFVAYSLVRNDPGKGAWPRGLGTDDYRWLTFLLQVS